MMFRMKAPSNVNHPMAGLSFVALPNSRRQASRRFYPTPHRHLAEASEHRTIPVASERHSFGGGVFQESPDLSENTGEFVQAKVQQLTVAHLIQPAPSLCSDPNCRRPADLELGLVIPRVKEKNYPPRRICIGVVCRYFFIAEVRWLWLEKPLRWATSAIVSLPPTSSFSANASRRFTRY
jgi:hypothetical protein